MKHLRIGPTTACGIYLWVPTAPMVKPNRVDSCDGTYCPACLTVALPFTS